ncbi:hypothetical protein FB45DRAFT_900816 [Roridomyces roridus]|uniref:DNA polymerase epsilon subunit D n=1 Tax=Roridomyces roridus TaxID=1738132 RepID=A0AAD7C8C9_9AGAR|nr:hypothetical protein FB45DRAFT_900816 [Roridomyces roridus]
MEKIGPPKSLVTRIGIAKFALPENVKMQKETVLSLIKGSTVFINYLGAFSSGGSRVWVSHATRRSSCYLTRFPSSAHDVALSKQHKSISASDVLKALEMIEFGDLADKLQGELTGAKNGSSNVNGSAALKGKASFAKGKEKEKATIVLPGSAAPSTSGAHADGESISSRPGVAQGMDVDEDVELDVEGDPYAEVDVEEEQVQEPEDVDDGEDVDVVEPEDDTMEMNGLEEDNPQNGMED